LELSGVTATASPLGKQVDVSWQMDSAEDSADIMLVRGDKDYPHTADTGIVYDSVSFACDSRDRTVREAEDEMVEITDCYVNGTVRKRVENRFARDSGSFRKSVVTIFDSGLDEDRVYYYSLFLKQGESYGTGRRLQASAFSTSNHDYPAKLYEHVPRIYRTYDKAGRLRGLLEIFGCQLDLLQSYIEMSKHLYDIDKCPDGFLPLLARHIGWELDYSRNIPVQRTTLKGAVEIQKKTGTVNAIEAYVHSLTGCTSRVREFVHNIAMSNAPEEMYFEEGSCIVSRSKTVDTSDREYPDKDIIGNMKTYRDTLHYTFDTEREPEDWYSNDTIGIYLVEGQADVELRRLEDSFTGFLPFNVRALVITGKIIEDVFTEKLDIAGEGVDDHADILI